MIFEEIDKDHWTVNCDECVADGLARLGPEMPEELEALIDGWTNAVRVRQAELKSMTRH